jgi:hypothetical protein
VRFVPPVTRSLAWTRALGAFLDVAAVTLLLFAVGHRLGRPRLFVVLGLGAGGLLALRWRTRRAALAIQRGRPVLGTALEAYLEGGGGTLRPLLEKWVAARVGSVWLPRSFVGLAIALAAAAGVLAVPRPARPLPPALSAAVPTLSVTAQVQPPAYAGLPAYEAALPLVQGLRHSMVRLEVRTNAPRLLWAEKGGAEKVLVPEAGRATLSFPLERTVGLRLAVDGEGPVVLLSLEAVKDEAPRVTLEAPEADRTVTTRPGKLELAASAEDDVSVARLGFRWTLAQGLGEAMRFVNGVPTGHSAVHGRKAEATASIEPQALGMKAGDTLVVWAEASDANTLDGPGVGRSDARILRWDEALVEWNGPSTGTRLPPPTAQLSERELLARTERLLRSGATGQARRTRSEALAEDQRQIRESFGFFLQLENSTGTALDVDDAEVAESGDTKARKLLAEAVSEMWTAEGELAVGYPRGALAPMRAAVKALDKAFGNERLALRALHPPDKPVDEARRLSGVQTGLRPRAPDAPSAPQRDTSSVQALARRLLLAAEVGVTAEAARALADAVWGLPQESGLPASTLAAPLYAAKDEAARSAAAREAGVALARWLLPSPESVPPVSPDEGPVLARLPLSPAPG